MPILGSFGAAAARGFGETAGAGNVDVEYLITLKNVTVTLLNQTNQYKTQIEEML